MSKAKRTPLKDIRKNEIMQAALTVLSERGSSNVTLDDIAKASGFSKGGITYYYSSKEALIKDVFEYFYAYVYKRSYDEIAKHTDPLDKMFSFVWLYDQDDYQSKKMYPLLFDILILATHNDEYRSAFQAMVKAWIDIAKEVLEEGNSTGQFKIEDIDGTARLISATAQGIATRWYLDREHHSTDWAVKSYKDTVINCLKVRTS